MKKYNEIIERVANISTKLVEMVNLQRLDRLAIKSNQEKISNIQNSIKLNTEALCQFDKSIYNLEQQVKEIKAQQQNMFNGPTRFKTMGEIIK